jgi:hypothetical protein
VWKLTGPYSFGSMAFCTLREHLGLLWSTVLFRVRITWHFTNCFDIQYLLVRFNLVDSLLRRRESCLNLKNIRRTNYINNGWDHIPIVQPTRCTCYLKLFILVKRSTCFGPSFRPSSGAQNCVYSNGICQTAAATSSISSPIAVGSSSCLTYAVAVYVVLSSWWWTERRSETCRAF